MSLAVIAAGITLAIAFHEAAHLLTARRFGIAVTDAYWGFGPKVWSRRIGQTVYGIRWLPLGGYVKLASGRNDTWADGTPIPPGQLLESAARWKRTLVLLGGVAANVLFAFALLWGLALVNGKWKPDTQIERVVAGSAAETAGLRPGDRLIFIGDRRIGEWSDLGPAVADRPGHRVRIVAERNGQVVVFDDVTLGRLGEIGFLGVGPRTVNERMGPLESGVFAAESTIGGLAGTAASLYQLFNPVYVYDLLTGPDRTAATETRPVSLVGAVQVGSAAEPDRAWVIVASLNLSLAVLNALPFPPFDGGHVAWMFLGRFVKQRKIGKAVAGAAVAAVVAWMMFVVVTLVVLDVVSPVRL